MGFFKNLICLLVGNSYYKQFQRDLWHMNDLEKSRKRMFL